MTVRCSLYNEILHVVSSSVVPSSSHYKSDLLRDKPEGKTRESGKGRKTRVGRLKVQSCIVHVYVWLRLSRGCGEPRIIGYGIIRMGSFKTRYAFAGLPYSFLELRSGLTEKAPRLYFAYLDSAIRQHLWSSVHSIINCKHDS